MPNSIQYTPYINGSLHSWANVAVSISGVVVIGVTSINYKTEQEMEDVMGAGVEAIGRGYGNVKHEASITLKREEVESIRAASDTGRLQDIAPFPILVQFLPVNGQKLVTHRLLNCQFKTDGADLKQGATSDELEIPLAVNPIKYK